MPSLFEDHRDPLSYWYDIVIHNSKLGRTETQLSNAFNATVREQIDTPQTVENFIGKLAEHTQLGCDNPIVTTCTRYKLLRSEATIKSIGENLGMSFTKPVLAVGPP